MELKQLRSLAEGSREELEATRLFDNMEGSIEAVHKWANGQLLSDLLKKHGHPASESKAFIAAVKKMYSEFEDLKMAVMIPLQTTRGLREETELTKKEINELLNQVESKLDYEARWKNVDVFMDTKTVEWTTQETYDMDSKSVAANVIANFFKSKGATGWTIKVTVRDHGDSRWATAKS